MQSQVYSQGRNRIFLASFVCIGVIINVLLYFIMNKFDVPLYMDTLGTIFVTIAVGPFFGIMTAVISNTLCMVFNGHAIYYSAVNALIAVHTSSFMKRHSLKKQKDIAKLILLLAMVTGLLSTVIQYLLGEIHSTVTSRNAEYFSDNFGVPFILAVTMLNILLNIIDKGFSVAIVLGVLRIMPVKVSTLLRESTLKQSLSSIMHLKNADKNKSGIKYSIRTRETLSLVVTSIAIVVAMTWIGLNLYFEDGKQSRSENAYNVARFAAEVIDADRVEEFVKEGEAASGYKETKDMLTKIKENAAGINFLYAVVMRENGCQVVFDVDTEEQSGHEPGDVVSYEKDILPYVPALLNGEAIEPLVSDGIREWSETIFYPVKNSSGKTACYVGCQVSLGYDADYMRNFIIRVLLILAGLFILLVAHELWMTNIYVSYPIRSMSSVMDSFADSGDEQRALDENVRKIRELGIHTGDEVEKLYQTLCDMTLNQAEQMRNIRRLTDSTMKMQDGLILTMADMVESRDSDTGAHVQKTSAYVKIIVEGLRDKGYYPEKINPKFISDIVRSAPLHDVGKINISDKILNKPGKLTEEEFEIMKTHTTAGKEIIEKAINTVKGGSYLKEARNMAAYHHERWDGKGYPEGLHGEVIPLSARIMAVADVFDALTSRRVYKPPFTLEKALEILQEGAGSQFDAKCVEVFMDSLPEIKVILNKYNQ